MLITLLWSMPSGGEAILIGVVLLMFFGAKKIPELARGLGQGIREFKDATKEVKTEIQKETDSFKKEIND
jgi:sec-independent protein translocase protein TatA